MTTLEAEKAFHRRLLHRVEADAAIEPRVDGDAIAGQIILPVGGELRAFGDAEQALDGDALSDLAPDGGVIKISGVLAPAPEVIRADEHYLAKAVLLDGEDRHFTETRFLGGIG